MGYETPTKEEINNAFDAYPKISSEWIKFKPEIKVKRETDTLYISMIRKTKSGLIVTVEVFSPQHGGDKAPMPIGMLNDATLRAIYQVLKANQISKIKK